MIEDAGHSLLSLVAKGRSRDESLLRCAHIELRVDIWEEEGDFLFVVNLL